MLATKALEILAVYADGGVIQKNPSTLGGTWAWCHINTDLRVVDDVRQAIVESGSGILYPHTRGLEEFVSNNHSEYFALIRGLRELPEGWSGKVYSDSAITLGRFFSGWANKNVPDAWEPHLRKTLARLGKLEPQLLDGHPTRSQLAAGLGKRGNPCSSFNVWCDHRCGDEAKQFIAAHSPREARAAA